MSVLHSPMRFPPAPTLILVSAVILLMTGCASLVPLSSPGVALYDPVPKSIETGKASYYGGRWIGRLTANGERYHSGDCTAAHKHLPFNTMVRVTNLRNNKSVIVRINNRGPYAKGRILDLSLSGCRIRTDERFPVGIYTRVETEFRLEGLPFRLGGVVQAIHDRQTVGTTSSRSNTAD